MMWPSNTEVKKILSETGVLLFRDGHLQLNPSKDLAETILEKELLISAINNLNETFDQQEKLKLAVLLRDYIYSCHDFEQRQLDREEFWKNYLALLKDSLEFPIITILILIFSPIIIPFKWLDIKYTLWSEEKRRIKKQQNLEVTIKKSLKTTFSREPITSTEIIPITENTSNLTNPLIIHYGPKLFEIPEEKQRMETDNLSNEELIEKLTEKLKEKFKGHLAELIITLSTNLKRHIGEASTYALKDHLREGLQYIYYHLTEHFDPKLGVPPEKRVVIDKLLEGIIHCSEGFHERVNSIIESFNTVGNFSELLYSVRKFLIEKTAITQMQKYQLFNHSGNEIHTYYDFTRLAHSEGLGVPLSTDSYRGEMSWNQIRKALREEFQNSYTLDHLPRLLTEALKGLLIEAGYAGAKENTNPYSDAEVELFSLSLKNFLNPSCYQTVWGDFYLYDPNDLVEEKYTIVDIHWKSIETIFSKQLTTEDYFKISSNEEFKHDLSNLINYIEETGNNYFVLLAQVQPKSFNLLFYRLEKLERKESEELQEKLIPLFFKKDETDQAALPLFVQHYPDTFDRFLRFMDSDLSRQEMLQVLFIKHKNMIWNSFVFASERQPQSAFIVLRYCIQHFERLKFDCDSGCFFSENRSQIQQGLSHLLIQQKLDLDQKTTLLRFLKDYPTALPHPSQKIVDFLFDALSHIDDKPLIEAFINQHSGLLLKNFSVNYFKHQPKNLALMAKKLLDAYADELTTRKNTQIEYTTRFFNCHFGYSTSEKLKALTIIKDTLNNHSNIEKIEQLNQLKSDYPALNNGRLSQLFKACTHDVGITSHITLQAHI